MNGREIRLWKGLQGFPNKLFPGGYLLGSHGQRNGKFGMQDQVDLVQLDWDGNEVWRFDKLELIADPGEEPRWMARQHHDFQREGNPTGYYAPGLEPLSTGGTTLVLCHKNIVNHQISDKVLLDDVFVEVDWEGNIRWQWSANEHFEQLGFDEQAKNVLYRDPNMRSAGGGMGDWLHINSMSRIGPNKWYDNGDKRFHPDNIIWNSREANIIAVTSRQTGDIVWKIGPDYSTREFRHLGWIIGQHHAHIIPRGLPGEGNLLVFDNGGWAGYGYEPHVNNMVYRAYRVPYEWIPQLEKPPETAIPALDVTTFRVPGSAPFGGGVTIEIEGIIEQNNPIGAFCVASKEEAGSDKNQSAADSGDGS